MAKKDKKKKEDKIIKEIKGDFGSGGEIYKSEFPTDPLGQYTDPYSVDDRNHLNLRNAYASPLRKRNDAELAAAKANLQQQVSQNLIEQWQADAELANLKSGTIRNEAFAGNMSDDDMSTLNRMRDESDPNSASFIGGNSADINDIITRFKSGLEGYSAAENNAFRESAERGLDATAATERYNRTRDIARNRVRGGAATAQLAGIDRNRMQAGRELEQDLFIKNADEKQNRLKTFSDFTRLNDDTNFEKRRGAFGDFRDFLKDREDAAYGRGQDAIGDYENTLRDSQNTAFQLGSFNLGQKEKTDARDVGTKLGIVGLIGARRSAKRQDEILGG